MGTILDYIKEYGDYSFREKPLNEVDSLILSQFLYLKLDGVVEDLKADGTAVSIRFLDQKQKKERLFADTRFLEDNQTLFRSMRDSVRFGSIRLNYYENIVDHAEESQFSAAVIFLDDGTAYVAFRGTDETLVGWKEDFNLAFSHPVKGQLRSVEYLNALGEKLGHFYVGGHSKGGNFAFYAAMNCKEEVRKKILKIYNHDGPGFRPEVCREEDYEKIRYKAVKIIPHSSLVGLLLEYHAGEYRIVESKTLGLLQHNPYTWLVEEDHFLLVDEVYKGRRFMDETLNQWILSLKEEEMRVFVDTLYELVSVTEAETLLDFSEDWWKHAAGILAAVRELDEETWIGIRNIAASLFRLTRERAADQWQEYKEMKGWKQLLSYLSLPRHKDHLNH